MTARNLLTLALTAFALLASFPLYAEDQCKSNVKPKTFRAFQACTYREPGNGQWIVDGDIPIGTERELRRFYNALVNTKSSKGPAKTLGHIKPWVIVNVVNGADDLWPKGKSCGIRYCVSRATTGEHYTQAVALIKDAADEWSKHAGIRFIHMRELDSNCTDQTAQVDFDVQAVGERDYMVRAFFPSNERSRRNVLIDSRAFTQLKPPVTLVGVLRHEFGHIIGFRHEHTRPEAATCFEDNSWRPLTAYDSDSVMHYPQCGGTATSFLTLSPGDIVGVQAAYGAATQCSK